MPSAGIIQFDDGIAAVDTEYGRPLADASHLIVEKGRAAFVDTGVNDSVPLLLDALETQGLDVGDVDFVFLTHIHLDHAGGAGKLMQALPNARCVVHPRGAPHMIDPAKLVAGTEAVYGVEQARESYGTIEPIEADRVVEAEDEAWLELNGRALQTIYTEGHARHHYVLNDPAARGVFTGDSFGVSYRELDTAAGEFIFPTATPIDFDPDAAHRAYDRILACDPDFIFVTHYSRIGGDAEKLARLAEHLHDDIEAFRAMALECATASDRQQAIEKRMFGYLAERLEAHGYAGDRDALRSFLATDVVLNSQGLVVWLDRSRKNR
jgi:glyoxylase-like metal-dependent hydrolase (beta-lactamase superfamily II)